MRCATIAMAFVMFSISELVNKARLPSDRESGFRGRAYRCSCECAIVSHAERWGEGEYPQVAPVPD